MHILRLAIGTGYEAPAVYAWPGETTPLLLAVAHCSIRAHYVIGIGGTSTGRIGCP